MTITTVPVTGSYVPPDGSTIVGGQIVFALSGPDTESETVISGETVAELDGADLPAGFELWSNTAGERGTYYKVRARVYISHVTAGGTFQTERSYQLGNIQVGDAASYTLTELLNNPVPDEPSWNVNIDPTAWQELQDDFDAADTAATNASASATAAAGSATAADASADAAAASAVAAAASADDASAAGAYAAAASDSADDAAGSASDASSEAASAAASAVAAAASETAAGDSASDAATDAGLALTRANAAGASATAAAASAGAASGSATAAGASATAAAGSATAAAASATAAAGSATAASAAQGYATAAAGSADDAAAEAAAAQGYASDADASATAAAASEGAANVDAAQAASSASDAADSAADALAAKVAAEAARDEVRELYVTLEDFDAVGDGVTPDDAAFLAAAEAGGDVWATQGKTYLISAPVTVRGPTDFCLRMDGATIQMGEGCHAVYRFYEYTNSGIDFGATGKLIGNYDTDGAWASFATTPGITSGSATGTASASRSIGATSIPITGLGVGYVKKGYRFSHINSGTTYAYIVTADAVITAGAATITLDHGLEAPLTNGQLVYLNFWNNRWVVASNVGSSDTTITLEMANVTSADGSPAIMAGDQFAFHDDYNNIDAIDYTKVCTVALGGPVIGSYPAKTCTVTLTAPMGRTVAAGTMGTSIMDHRNNRFLPILFYGGTGGFVRGANTSNLRLHGFGQACINAPWDGADPSTKPNIDLCLENNADTSTGARGAFCVAAWSTRGLKIRGNRGTYSLGQLRSVAQVERSDDFDVTGNSIYGGQYLCRINGECSDGRITENRGIHMMRMLQQGNTSTRLTFEGNTGSGHADYTDYMIMVLSGMLDEDGASAGSALRINSTKVVENVFSGATRTTGATGYGSHIIIGPQNLDDAADEDDWPRQVWVFGNTSTGATYHGVYVLNGDSVTVETNFVSGSGLAGIYLQGGDNCDLLTNEVLDCCQDTDGAGIVLDGATNVRLDGNKTTVDTGTGMTSGLSLINGATLRGEPGSDWNGTVTSGGLSLIAKQSRADLEALATYGEVPPDGQVRQAADLFYIGSTGATALPDLPGWLPYGDVRPEHGGTGADLVSHQAAQDASTDEQRIVITKPAVMSGTVSQGADYRLRHAPNPIDWASSTDVSRAIPGVANAAAAKIAASWWHLTDASDSSAPMLFASYRANPSSSVADIEKDAFLAVAITADPADGASSGLPGASINRGVVGVGARAVIAAGNATGQIWGLNALATISAGSDGYASCIECNLENIGGTTATQYTVPMQKRGIGITTKEGTGTVGLVVVKGNGDGWIKGIAVASDAINASGDNAYEYQGKWRVDKAGNLFLNKATGADTEEGIALYQTLGLAVFTRSDATQGTTRFVRGDTLGGAATLWNLDLAGYNTAASQKTFARIQSAATTATAGAEAGDLRLYTIQAGTVTESLRLNGTGAVLAFGAGGMGYGTGAGGTVTQTTGRTTGVTLNKPSGQITLVSAAGSTTWASFTLTNSVIGLADSIVVSQRSGTDLYEIHVTNVSTGSCVISFRTTGGTTTEQPVFNFSVRKGATS
jgi:parallel beta-helix repeat protein